MNDQNNSIRAKDAKSNFGKYGWLIIVLGALMYFCSASVLVEGSNLIIPAYAEAHGVGTAGLYTISTIASLFGIPLSVAAGIFMTRKGPRFVMATTWILGGLGLFVMGISSGYVLYCIGRIFVNFASVGGITIGLNGLIANWCPTKKDLVQGYATIGSNLATALALIVLSALLAVMSIGETFFVCGVAFIIVGILSYVLFKDNPEDAGCFPDNDKDMTREQAMEMHRIGEEYKKTSPWTVKKLLKTKQTWQIAIGYGIIMLITVGVLSTFVTTLHSKV
ncbi:MAG: MFS transporter [Oscillospiraceae bacterium]|nr:MFS transporter [Oscillospiraceae bacterium]